MSYKKISALFFAAISGFAALYIDLAIRQGYTEWPFYLFPCFFIGFLRENKLSVAAAAVSSVLLGVGYLYPSSEDVSAAIVIFHRAVGLSMIWMVTAVVLIKNRYSEQTDRALLGRSASEERFRNLADSMPQLVWTANPDGEVDYYNQRYREFGGLSPGPGGKWEWAPVLYNDDVQRTVDAWDRSIKTGEIYQIEHRVKHADGSLHWYLSRAVPVRNYQGRITKWYGTATNIDDQKQAEEGLQKREDDLKLLAQSLEEQVTRRTAQVRELAKALTLAEQRERQRLSLLLHENLQQLLFAANARFDLLVGELQTVSARTNEDVAEIQRLTKTALDASQMLAIELNPPVLKEEGLDAAVKWLVLHMQNRYGLSILLRIHAPFKAIQEDERILIIQLIRELLYNIVKHAHVKAAGLTLLREENNAVIQIEDKGIGFEVEKTRSELKDRKQFGLFSIEERLKLFGGSMQIESVANKGTMITIKFPVSIAP